MSNHDLVFLTGEEWTPFSQRAQSLAIEFAKRGNRVFFFEPMLSIGKVIAYLFKGKSLDLPAIDQENIRLLRPKFSMSTFRASRTSLLDKLLFNVWFSCVRSKYGIANDAVIYINLPYWWGNIVGREIFPNSRIIYDCIDDCRVYSRNERALKIMEESELELAREADTVLATALSLYEKLKPVNDSIHLLSNGVDTSRFIRQEYSVPDELKSFKTPLLGFVGALFHWIDFDAFARIASAFRNVSIILVGPTNSNEVENLTKKFSNIHYLGPKPYSRVPEFINAFDVCLNPFKVDEIGENVNPLKLYEYLCLGKPVISSSTREMRNFAEYVYLYRDHDELVQAAGKAINESIDDPERGKRIRFAIGNSWSAKVDKIEQLIGWGET